MSKIIFHIIIFSIFCSLLYWKNTNTENFTIPEGERENYIIATIQKKKNKKIGDIPLTNMKYIYTIDKTFLYSYVPVEIKYGKLFTYNEITYNNNLYKANILNTSKDDIELDGNCTNIESNNTYYFNIIYKIRSSKKIIEENDMYNNTLKIIITYNKDGISIKDEIIGNVKNINHITCNYNMKKANITTSEVSMENDFYSIIEDDDTIFETKDFILLLLYAFNLHYIIYELYNTVL